MHNPSIRSLSVIRRFTKTHDQPLATSKGRNFAYAAASPNRFELQHIRLTNSNPLLRPLMICRMSTTLESATVKNETPDYGSVAYWDERCVR